MLISITDLVMEQLKTLYDLAVATEHERHAEMMAIDPLAPDGHHSYQQAFDRWTRACRASDEYLEEIEERHLLARGI
jgi:hypothetical protein